MCPAFRCDLYVGRCNPTADALQSRSRGPKAVCLLPTRCQSYYNMKMVNKLTQASVYLYNSFSSLHRSDARLRAAGCLGEARALLSNFVKLCAFLSRPSTGNQQNQAPLVVCGYMLLLCVTTIAFAIYRSPPPINKSTPPPSPSS